MKIAHDMRGERGKGSVFVNLSASVSVAVQEHPSRVGSCPTFDHGVAPQQFVVEAAAASVQDRDVLAVLCQ